VGRPAGLATDDNYLNSAISLAYVDIHRWKKFQERTIKRKRRRGC
jgi:hypothetical protein